MTAPTPDLDSMTARAVDRVHEDALADSRSLDKDDLTRLARYISDGFEAELDAALAAVTTEREGVKFLLRKTEDELHQERSQHEATKSTLRQAWDELRQARQMLADAPHQYMVCQTYNGAECSCWKAGL